MRIRLFVLSLLSFLLIAGVGCERMDTRLDPLVIEANQRENPAWYDEAKVGIFIHWGPYAVPGVGEWYWCNRFYDSFVRQYHEDTYGADFPYENFGPMWKELVDDGDTWDPDAWAELFELAGARYVVLTAKHHDGFLLWPSDTPNPYIDGWQLERDAVGELGFGGSNPRPAVRRLLLRRLRLDVSFSRSGKVSSACSRCAWTQSPSARTQKRTTAS